jgi:hypothetical protein
VLLCLIAPFARTAGARPHHSIKLRGGVQRFPRDQVECGRSPDYHDFTKSSVFRGTGSTTDAERAADRKWARLREFSGREIILERRARSNRNAGRHHRGFASDFPRNPQFDPLERSGHPQKPTDIDGIICMILSRGKALCTAKLTSVRGQTRRSDTLLIEISQAFLDGGVAEVKSAAIPGRGLSGVARSTANTSPAKETVVKSLPQP